MKSINQHILKLIYSFLNNRLFLFKILSVIDYDYPFRLLINKFDVIFFIILRLIQLIIVKDYFFEIYIFKFLHFDLNNFFLIKFLMIKFP
jgi:hypothetical protein